MRPDDMRLVFWRLSFKPAFSFLGFLGDSEGKVAACIWETRFDLWVWTILWKRKWEPTLVLLLGKSHGRRSLVSPWGHKESDTTERLHFLRLQGACLSSFLFFFFFFSFSSFTFINGLFHFPSISATRVVPSVYLRLLIFLPPILSPAYASLSTTFHMMYSALSWISNVTIRSLDIPFPSTEPVCCSMSGFNCSFLTYIQISQEEDKVVWCSHLFKNCPQFIVVQKVKGFSIINEAVVDVFLEFSCLF